MARPIKLKINVKRILKDHLYEGKNGMYLDLVAWPNKNGPDQYGNTHMVCQELSREARDKGERGPIIGNLLLPEEEFMPTGKVTGDGRSERKRPAPAPPLDTVNDDDDIPF
jgi:hypothetical protein